MSRHQREDSDNEYEETPLNSIDFSYEDDNNKTLSTPIVLRDLNNHSAHPKALKDKTKSLHIMEVPQQRHKVFNTTPIKDSTETLEEGFSSKSINVVTMKNSVPPHVKQKRLNTLLLEALKSREAAAIEKLIIAGANPNATCCVDYISACHIAAMRPDGALGILISHGAETNRPDSTNRTPLHLAAWVGNVRHMAMLLGLPNDLIHRLCTTVNQTVATEVRNASGQIKDQINMKTSQNFSKAKVPIPEEWMDSMTDHECKEFKDTLPQFQAGWTPLHAASAQARSHCVWLLLAAGANPSQGDTRGRKPLDIVGSSYYSDESIDSQSFAEIVAMLAVNKDNISIKNRNTSDTPIHTAVELDSLQAVNILLNAQVPVIWRNRAGLTPLHICVKKKLREMLQVLVNNRIVVEDETCLMPAVDVRDTDGNTVLQFAILENWEAGVSIALEADASITTKNNKGETALHLAAEIGNVEILKKILARVHCESIVNLQNSQKETPLIKAVRNGHTKCVKSLLEEKASIKIVLDNQVNVFHIAAEKGYTEVLQILLDDDYTVTRGMINYLTEDDDGFGPIHYAVQNNHLNCVKLLLARNAFRSLKTTVSGTHNGSTPLHLAAKHNHVKIAKVIIKYNTETLDITNGHDWTALHTASSYGSRDVIALLLKEGANLAHIATGASKKEKITSMDLIMNNLSKPTEFLQSIFDDYISTNDCNIQDPNCKVTVNYQALVPKSEGQEQMKVIEALLVTGDRHGQRNLLVHPLLESFLHLKWRALLPFFYSMIVVYGVYVALLTVFVLAEYSNKANHPLLKWVDTRGVLSVVLYVSSFFVVVVEALYVHINYKYFLQIETWIKFGSIMLALSLPNSILTTTGEEEAYPRHIATISILMSWLEMMFLLSRFPSWGYYVLMFGKVCCTVLKILLTFFFLLMGFSLSFMIQFHNEAPFDGLFASVVKVLVMMTSEYDYANLANETVLVDPPSKTGSENYLPSVDVFRCVFLLFLILTPIVLMNLMVGVAVNDLHQLQVLGNVRRLTKQVEFLVSLDRLLYNRYLRTIIPKAIETLLLNRKTIANVVVLRPGDTRSEYYQKLPTNIRDAIFEKAQLRKTQMEDEISSQNYNKKIDEIHDATVKRKPKTEAPPPSTTKFVSFDLSNPSFHKNTSKRFLDLDSGIVDGNKNNMETLVELRSAINNLEMKMDMIINNMQNNQSNSKLKTFHT